MAAGLVPDLITKHPDLFQAFFMASPTHIDRERVNNIKRHLLKSTSNHYIYATLGEVETWSTASMQALEEVIISSPKSAIEWEYELMTNQDHYTTPLITIDNGLLKYFDNYEVFSVEEKLMLPIKELKDLGYEFKGYIDLVLKTEDGKYHIIDWKTCSWGWDAKKRSDKYITYQLTLYKKFFCEKHNIDPKLVETHFALLKRTAKKDHVEIFRVTSGPRKIQNATDLLVKGVRTINSGVHFKNRNSCGYCEFKNTKHCPR